MLAGQKILWRRKRRWVLIASSVVALLVAFLLFYEPASPDGIYFDPYIGCEHGVWILKNGKVYVQCVGQEAPHDEGVYVKSGNQWIGKSGGVIKPSILGITFYDSSFKNGHAFFFRDQFSWVGYLQRFF
jgi:hypothetical protein